MILAETLPARSKHMINGDMSHRSGWKALDNAFANKHTTARYASSTRDACLGKGKAAALSAIFDVKQVRQ